MKNVTMKKRSLGQGMTEYIIIVALIAVAAIGVFTAFGDVVRNQVGGMATELSGKKATTQKTNINNAGTQATSRSKAKKLDNWMDDNGN